jgi:LysM repeat protein
MNSRTRLYVVIPALLVLALAMTSCEKDRPVSTPSSTTAEPASGEALTATPEAATTPGATSAQTPTGSQAGSGSPAPSGSPGAATSTSATASVTRTATQVAGQGTVYKVQLGDTLGSIAKEFGVTTEAIVQLNSLTNPDVLMVGQELKIPGQQPASAQGGSGQTSEETYVVTSGDTLSVIARRFGVSLAELQSLNGITNPDQISVGQTLRIPSGAAGSSAATPASGQAKTYVVQQGDTLFKIALRFGITVAALQSANDITDPDKVFPGQVLKIP